MQRYFGVKILLVWATARRAKRRAPGYNCTGFFNGTGAIHGSYVDIPAEWNEEATRGDQQGNPCEV